MRDGDDVVVQITALHDGGDGLAVSKKGRAPLRVPGAFPGERVRARLTHVGKNQSHALLRDVIAPRDGRRTVPCAMHADTESGRCTGCAFMPLAPNAQRVVKRDWLREAFGLEVDEVIGGAARGYRWSSKRVAFGGPGNIRLGSYVRGTHNVALMAGCRVEHPSITRAVDVVARAARRTDLAAWDDKRGGGDLRHVWFKTDGERVLVTLIMAHDQEDASAAIADAIRRDDDAAVIVGVARSVNAGTGNTIRGGAPEMLFGRDTLRVRIAGVATEVGPLGFLQPNPGMAGRCYEDLVEGASGDVALDLYAGAGVTTALLRRHVAEVTPVEAYPESAAALGVPPTDVAEYLSDYDGPAPDVVIANPPRKGMGAAVTDALRTLGPLTLRVMSCGPKGLARDIAALGAEAGAGQHRYRLTRLRAYDTLPETPHVELVAHLSREA